MIILSIAKPAQLADLLKAQVSETETKSPSFSEFLSQSVNEVSSMLATADRKNTELAIGKTENLHEAMLSFEKADSAFRLLTQVRNKAIEAYQDILKMQV